MSKSVFEHYKFYYYLDIMVIVCIAVPFLGFSRYTTEETTVGRNCLPIMSIWMILLSLLMLIQILFLLFKDMSTIINEGRSVKETDY